MRKRHWRKTRYVEAFSSKHNIMAKRMRERISKEKIKDERKNKSKWQIWLEKTKIKVLLALFIFYRLIKKIKKNKKDATK